MTMPPPRPYTKVSMAAGLVLAAVLGACGNGGLPRSSDAASASGDAAGPDSPPALESGAVEPGAGDGSSVPSDTGPDSPLTPDGPGPADASHPDRRADGPEPLPCGSSGQPCCRGDLCSAPDTRCTDDLCRACGEPGKACCLDNGCQLGGCCVDQGLERICVRAGESCRDSGGVCGLSSVAPSSCGACGGLGQACCGSFCSAAGTTCDATTGRCARCGAPGQPCCVSGYQSPRCTTPDRACDSAGRCSPCGGEGQQCCFGADPCDAGTGCSFPPGGGAGVCRQCGGPGQVCCAGSACSAATTVCTQSGRCQVCGGAGQPCCANDRCSADGAACFTRPLCSPNCGTCELCGGPGQQCCPERACRSPLVCAGDGGGICNR
jgi:hypothetical protein